MSKELYAVAHTPNSNATQGLFADVTKSRCNFFTNAKEAEAFIKQIHKPEVASGYQVAMGPSKIQPTMATVTSIYRVELSDAEFAKLQDVTPTFSAGRYTGIIPEGSIIDAVHMVSGDTLHNGRCFVETARDGTLDHAAVINDVTAKGKATEAFASALSQTHENDRKNINPNLTVTASALSFTYAADGFVNQDPSLLSETDAFCQSIMKLMVQDAPVTLAIKSEQFYKAYQKNLTSICATTPDMNTVDAAEMAMLKTAEDFKAHVGQERLANAPQTLDNMAKVASECARACRESGANLSDATRKIVGEVLHEGADYVDAIADDFIFDNTIGNVR